MHLNTAAYAVGGLWLGTASATPAPANGGNHVTERGLIGGIVGGLVGDLEGLVSDVEGLLEGVTDATGILDILENTEPKGTPTNVAQVSSTLQAIYSTTSTSFWVDIGVQIEAGLVPDSIIGSTPDLDTGVNSQVNENTREPESSIYPQKDESDPLYSLSEEQLRQVIYIPEGFTYGDKPPTIFVPGTGSYGGNTFGPNLRKLLTGVDYADPVWLNIPEAMLNDTQSNAEYIAYAINYISGISQNSNVSIISWSQGGLDTQWVFTYWPSTRSVVSDFLPVSPDFHGTILAYVLCLDTDATPGLNPCAPAVLQQEYNSDYISTLRADGGASAYVPTTTFYSSLLDEIVQPQQGTGASAYLLDERGVGVSNNDLQEVCAGHLGGTFYGHAGALYNPLTYALIVDALTNDGPGDVSRLNIADVCAPYSAPGLDLVDVLETAGLIVTAALQILAYPEKVSTEPVLMSYAA
ncbi:hypothetical protein E8E14_014963 [Neopestalotiopsis sp. 37M]|nr:hypothetical protein E8E14_014963 [Neopestalotiopsis sp. 37M]